MHLTSYLENGHLTIELVGEIDHHSARSYMDAILGKLEAYIPINCILDFSSVSFMDSSGIAVIISALRQIVKLGGKLDVAGMKPQPYKVFLASGMDKLVKVKEKIV